MTDRNPSVVLTVNFGSSSLKTALYDATDGVPRPLAKATIGRLSDRKLVVETAAARSEHVVSGEPLTAIGDALESAGLPTPHAVGHRFVHGGDYASAQLLSPDALAYLQRLAVWAPQHQPKVLKGVADTRARWPESTQVGCFDSAFHRTMPEIAQRLPFPRALWDAGIRRYGFHGLSYEHVVHTVGGAELGRAVIAHLGNGTSMAAVADGRSVDTTMGLTPDAGLFMGSRSGDVDPGLMLYLATREQSPLSSAELATLLQEESGLRGLSGGESDMQTLLQRDDPDARLAIDSFCRQIAKQAGAYASVLGGVDTLVFTGGIGEHAAPIRAAVVKQLSFMTIGQVLVIPTDEEAVIARQTAALIAPTR